jgi:hypothetical protein
MLHFQSRDHFRLESEKLEKLYGVRQTVVKTLSDSLLFWRHRHICGKRHRNTRTARQSGSDKLLVQHMPTTGSEGLLASDISPPYIETFLNSLLQMSFKKQVQSLRNSTNLYFELRMLEGGMEDHISSLSPTWMPKGL